MSTPAEQQSLSVRSCSPVDQILKEHDYQPERLIQILQAIQDQYRYLPQEALNHVVEALDIPATRVFGVATFYSKLSMKPRGKYIIQLCDGTSCHVKHSIPILEALRSRLKLSRGMVTSENMLFTIETVACLGACNISPVMLINEEVHGQVTPDSAVALIDAIIAQEEGT
jgi:NADH-quinone oxidoreductase subunit E